MTSLCTWKHCKLNSAFKVKAIRGDTEIVREAELWQTEGTFQQENWKETLVKGKSKQ